MSELSRAGCCVGCKWCPHIMPVRRDVDFRSFPENSGRKAVNRRKPPRRRHFEHARDRKASETASHPVCRRGTIRTNVSRETSARNGQDDAAARRCGGRATVRRCTVRQQTSGMRKALRREGGGAGLGEGCRLSAPQTQNARGATARGGVSGPAGPRALTRRPARGPAGSRR